MLVCIGKLSARGTDYTVTGEKPPDKSPPVKS